MTPATLPEGSGAAITLTGLMLLLSSCASFDRPAPRPPVATVTPGTEIARDEGFVWLSAREGDTEDTISQTVFGDMLHGQRVKPATAADGPALKAGDPVAVSLKPIHLCGPAAGGDDGVTILTYHRLAPRNPSRTKMIVTSEQFKAQMRYLVENGYHVVPLRLFEAYLSGKDDLPSKSVVITFDDGYRSLLTEAAPELERRKLPATVFVYLDFIGSPDALSFTDLHQLAADGLIDVQYHSKTHQDLTIVRRDDTSDTRRRRLSQEFASDAVLARRAGIAPSVYFAFPYGAADLRVLKTMEDEGRWRLGLTVLPGQETCWADPKLLRRTMVFGTDSLAEFVGKLALRPRPPSK